MKYQIIYYLPEKEKNYYVQAADEYRKRLSLYCKTSCKQVKKEKEWIKLWAGEKQRVLLLPGPASVSSEEFAGMLGEWEMEACGKVTFFIPDTRELDGWLEKLVKDKASGQETIPLAEKACKKEIDDFSIFNLSDFTLEPQLLKVLLFEQIYRGYRIRNNHPYHK